jgi:hypothetical protein
MGGEDGVGCRCHEIEEAFSMLDVDSTGLIPLAHAVGILLSLPGCKAWPNTSVILKIVSPFLVNPAKESNNNKSPEQSSTADVLLNYRNFLQAHGGARASLIGLAEARQNSGVYDQLTLLRS